MRKNKSREEFRMQIPSRSTKSIGVALCALLAAIVLTVTNSMAQAVTYTGQMTLNWTIDNYTCPGMFQDCYNQQAETSSFSGTEIIPLSADYSPCYFSTIGTGPAIVPFGSGAPDIVFIVPYDDAPIATCPRPYLFYPGPGAFWYDGDIATPDGSFPVVPPDVDAVFAEYGELDILSWD